MTDMIGIGMIGAGNIAQAHLRAISNLDNARVAAVMDVRSESAQAAAGEYGGRAYTELEDILGDPEVDAVHVCTPHDRHADQAVTAAGAGKHVLVEKPMALSVADCDRMIAACRDAGTVLMVGQVLRYRPVNLKARELIAGGTLGDIGHMMRRRYSRFNPGVGHWYLDPDRGGNCALYCFGPHEYDLLHWLIRSPVVTVYAQGSESGELLAGQCDSYSSLMTHTNGAVSVMSQSLSCDQGAWDQHVIGSAGSMFLTAQSLRVNGEEVEVEGTAADGMRLQIQEFADCCLGRGEPDASGVSVRHTMEVIEAVQQSAATGAVVRLGS